MSSIQGISTSPLNPQSASPSIQSAGGTSSFKDILLGSIDQVNSMQQDADAAVENLFTGGEANPSEVLSAVQKADLAFRMMMQVRNKLVAALQEVKEIRI
jgi:flagellar hook-basal body complex protein FliE